MNRPLVERGGEREKPPPPFPSLSSLFFPKQRACSRARQRQIRDCSQSSPRDEIRTLLTPHIFATLKNAVSKYALYYPTHGVNQYLVDVKFYFTNILKINQSKNPLLPREIPTSSPGLFPQKKWVEREIGTGLASHAENFDGKNPLF